MKQNLTYIIKSQGHYKIGKTKDLETRVKVFDTHCFSFTVVKLIHLDIEEALHEIFKHKRVKLEWFALSKEDLESIDKIVLDYQGYCENFTTWLSKGAKTKGIKYFGETARKNMSIAAKRRPSNQDKKVLQKDIQGNIINTFDSVIKAARSQGFKNKMSLNSLRKNRPKFIWEFM